MSKVSFNKETLVLVAIIATGLFIACFAVGRAWTLTSSYFSLATQLADHRSNLMFEADHSVEQLPESDGLKSIVQQMSQICNKEQVKITQIEPLRFFDENEVQIVTQQMTLQGEFVSLLRCVEQVQRDNKGSKIASLKFKRELSTDKRPVLLLDIFFQSIKAIK